MGNCCATPCWVNIQKKKAKKIQKARFAIDKLGKESSKLVVLSNPTGHNIEERYELGNELGRGEFGITYLCTDKLTGEVFACKKISKQQLKTVVDIEDVRREADIMRRMQSHPNIVSLKDTYEDDDAVHLVMELCEGGELFDRIVSRGHYTEREAATILRTIIKVVQVRSITMCALSVLCAFI